MWTISLGGKLAAYAYEFFEVTSEIENMRAREAQKHEVRLYDRFVLRWLALPSPGVPSLPMDEQQSRGRSCIAP